MPKELKTRASEKAGAAERRSDATTRLRQLDHELDQEGALQIGAAVLGFIGAVLSLTVNGAFAVLPALAFATLGHYALQGWCLPLPLLARLGFRSSSEIDRERYALAATVAEPSIPALGAAGAD